MNELSNTAPEAGAKENTAVTVIKAIIGAMLGSVPSMFLWLVIGKVGYLAAISGFFMIMGELIACDRFTKKSRHMNFATAVVICSAVMAVNIYLCSRFVWAWQLSDILWENGISISVFECFADLGELNLDLGLDTNFGIYLIKSYAFAILGAFIGCKKLSDSRFAAADIR